MSIRWIIGIAGTLAVGGAAVIGCSTAGAQQKPPAPTGQQAKPPAGQAAGPGPGGKPAKPGAIARSRPVAGVPIRSVEDRKVVDKMWVAMKSPPRADPFALLQKERAYEAYASAQVRAQRAGTFPNYYVEPPERLQTFINEQQPYRRLAAVLIGESISALIDMGDGRGLQRIRPGQRIQGTEWIVSSIDADKAVLVRVPNSRKRPSEVVVRLESPPRSVPQAGGGAAPQGEGAPAGGQPAMPQRGRGGRGRAGL